MHIVYLMKFDREQLPNLYIGSKSNCRIVDGKMIGERGLYEGSCKSKMFLETKSTCEYQVFVLGEFENYNDALTAEKNAHIINDVVVSPKYFNQAIATINSYSNPLYATYKNVSTGKIARLPRDHIEVLNRNWLGVTADTKYSEERRSKIKDMSGENNPFYGKKHSQESLKKMAFHSSRIGKLSWTNRSQESRDKFMERARSPKTNEHRKKIGRPDHITLLNLETQKCIRISKQDRKLFCPILWINGVRGRKIIKLNISHFFTNKEYIRVWKEMLTYLENSDTETIPHKSQYDKIIEMVALGLSQHEIAKSFASHQTRISQILKARK